MGVPSSPLQVPDEPALPTMGGTKRSAPSLLPPFEPLSSSPGLPRPAKRQNTSNEYTKYVTPLPTSSTGLFCSSPLRGVDASEPQRGRDLFTSTFSVTGRAPLSDLRSVELKESGEMLVMGRSSANSHYQLSTNRLISRIHVKARYIPSPDPPKPNKVEVYCCGWNGLQVNCQGTTWELEKGDVFASEMEGAELMIGVQDTRVLLQWPRRAKYPASLSDGWESESSRSGDKTDRDASGGDGTSPLLRSRRLISPVSPSPALASLPGSHGLEHLMPSSSDLGEPVQIYEDPDDQTMLPRLATPVATASNTQLDSFSSDLSEPDSDDDGDPDEENDPVVQSFGPFGANLSRSFEIFGTVSPRKGARAARGPLDIAEIADNDFNAGCDSSNVPDRQTAAASIATSASPFVCELGSEQQLTITNHVVDHLAFSRLASNPLSGILASLPVDKKTRLTKDSLRSLLQTTACIGVITREGKDAAGKPLESEYYYIPEKDDDEHRRLTVTDGLRKPTLRNCRKKHKQYYWKRPRTP